MFRIFLYCIIVYTLKIITKSLNALCNFLNPPPCFLSINLILWLIKQIFIGVMCGITQSVVCSVLIINIYWSCKRTNFVSEFSFHEIGRCFFMILLETKHPQISYIKIIYKLKKVLVTFEHWHVQIPCRQRSAVVIWLNHGRNFRILLDVTNKESSMYFVT